MKIPRDLTGAELAKLLQKFGYRISRQKGSHIRITPPEPSEHHVTIPNHDPLKIGTLSAILTEIADFQGLSKEQLMHELFS